MKTTIEGYRNEISKIQDEIHQIKLNKRLLFSVEEHPNGELLKVRARMWKREVTPAFTRTSPLKADIKEAYERAVWIRDSFKKLAN